jgi:hypothetical protein
MDVFGTVRVLEPSPDQLFSDAGLLPIRQFTASHTPLLPLAANPDPQWKR